MFHWGSEGKFDHLKHALTHAVAALRQLQHKDGHFCGELEGDSILQSEYLLMKFILGQEKLPLVDGRDGYETLEKIARYLRRQQRSDGGWGQYPGSGIDLSATVKGYFALKLMGDDPQADHMTKAREVILQSGGAECCNSFTNFYLACLGQISWNAVPAIPPEIILLPRWFYFHISKVSAWTRTMILTLSLVVTLRPTRKLPERLGIDELYVDQRARHRLKNLARAPRHWSAFFLTIDRVLKILQAMGGTPVRKIAINRIVQWINDRAGQDGVAATDGLGAIFPPMVYLQVAFTALGYRRNHPILRRAERELDEFFIEQTLDGEETIRIQPCFSPVWDTGIALYALTDCRFDQQDQSVASAAQWLCEKECHHIGDWIVNIPRSARRGYRTKRGGAGVCGGGWWYFEYHNAWYPDVDDTAMVAMALKRSGGQSNENAAQRGIEWILKMQNDDGGWAAFDRTRHRQILEYIPFADHNAMQDPSCPDITGRVLECLSWNGYTVRDVTVQRGIEYIKTRQEPEGCFFGRWGVNYIYGTWQAVIGPIRCGVDTNEPWIQRAGAWIKSVQKDDGSFGETANSYEDPSLKGQGSSTASQTAWAAMILQEIYGKDDPDLLRALSWLALSQLQAADADNPASNPEGDPAGSWVETEFTGTGFPRVFYLRYHLYRLYFPLMAIGRFLAAHDDLPEREKTLNNTQERESVLV